MIDEIREKIDLNKKDRESYKNYIKSFTSSDKAKEFFAENNSFKKLLGEKEEELPNEKEEDEFF